MTRIALTALSLLALSTAAALAGEGNGAPFDQQLPGIVTTLATANSPRITAPVPARPAYAALLHSNSGMGVVQTANSLPRGSF